MPVGKITAANLIIFIILPKLCRCIIDRWLEIIYNMAVDNDIRLLTAVFALMCAILQGCGGPAAEKSAPRPFPVPEVPSMIGSGNEAITYLATHFWDDFTDTSETYVCDSSTVNGVHTDDVEQAFADWSGYLQASPPGDACKAVSVMFGRISAFERRDTSTNVFETISSLAEKYLYDPNSPLRSEDLYLPFASAMSSSPLVPPEKRAVYEYDAKMCSLNRTGSPAADFRFMDKAGRIHTLYDIDAEYTLLFFSNPGCEACKYIIDSLESDTALGPMVSSGRLAVANIYIDEDIEAWYGYQDIYPDSWYNGYDPDFIIRTDLLYNVRAIPSLYLLDRDKKVLLKDAPEDRVFAALHRIGDGQ